MQRPPLNVRPAWWLKPVNALLAPFGGRFGEEGSFDAALRAASSASGLPWIPDEPFLADMRVLHDAWQAVPDLTPVGRFALWNEIRRRLETRLRMLHLLDAHPVDRPVFLTSSSS